MIDRDRDLRWYEERKRAIVCAVLTCRHYESVFEPACGYGALTRMLGQRSKALLAMDADLPSIVGAQAAYQGTATATFRCGRLPQDWPTGVFDLVILSEWLYYIDSASRSEVATGVNRTLASDGEVVAIHWRHPIPETHESVIDMHAKLGTELDARHFLSLHDDDFILDAWTRRPHSVASGEGLV